MACGRVRFMKYREAQAQAYKRWGEAGFVTRYRRQWVEHKYQVGKMIRVAHTGSRQFCFNPLGKGNSWEEAFADWDEKVKRKKHEKNIS